MDHVDTSADAFWARWNDLRSLLSVRFPAAFVPDGQSRKPLKLGIHHDLAAALNGSLSQREVRSFLAAWCRRRRYREAIMAGGLRIGLDGLPVGEVMPQHVSHARSVEARHVRRCESSDASGAIAA